MLRQKRGKNVAVAGAVIQLVMSVVLLAVWLWTDSLAAMSCTWLLAGGIPVWLMAALLFYCRQLAKREEIELEDLAAERGRAGSVFEGEQADEFRRAAARVAWIERWAVPIFTLLWAGYQAAVGIVMLRYLGAREAAQLTNALQGVLFMVLVGMAGFLFGRYAVGMSALADWRLLRATGSYLLGCVLFVAGAAASLIAGHYDVMGVDLVVAYVVPIVQIVIAVELALNLMLDIYRPRVPGQEQRVSFDSRLLNLLAEPGRIGHSIAETLNYQFGFEVSKTWFYKLLQRAFVPLIVAGAAVLVGMSSILIVNEGEVCVVERWSRLQLERGELGPGVHLKYPWPIETARWFEKGRTQRILLGVGRERSEAERKASFIKGREVYLWTEEHGPHEEKDFLVATMPRSEKAEEKEESGQVRGVNVVKLVIALDYRIVSPRDYGYRFADAERVLEHIAHQEMVHYCATATLTEEELEESAGAGSGAIMSSGRQRIAPELRELIQRRATKLRLGVEITRLAVIAAHPPKETAADYLEIPKAERRRDEQRSLAQADANRELASVAGDPYMALGLALAVEAKNQLERLRNLGPASPQFADALAGLIENVRGRLGRLEQRQERERLLGQFKDQEGKSLRRLHQRYVDYLQVLESLRENPTASLLEEVLVSATSEVDKAFDNMAAGRPVKLVNDAVAYRWQTELDYRAKATAFPRRLAAFRANSRTYTEDLWQETWEDAWPNIADKIILGIDPRRVETWENMEKSRAGTFRLLGKSTGE